MGQVCRWRWRFVANKCVMQRATCHVTLNLWRAAAGRASMCDSAIAWMKRQSHWTWSVKLIVVLFLCRMRGGGFHFWSSWFVCNNLFLNGEWIRWNDLVDKFQQRNLMNVCFLGCDFMNESRNKYSIFVKVIRAESTEKLSDFPFQNMLKHSSHIHSDRTSRAYCGTGTPNNWPSVTSMRVSPQTH